jgi:integrase
MARRRRPTAREGADGWFHLWVTIGTRPNGRPLQRHIKRATKAAAEDAADDLLDELKAGKVRKTGAKPTVQEWMTTYLTTIAPRRCNPDTIYDYHSKLRNWVYPTYGAKRIDRFNDSDLDAIYLAMQRAGKAQSHQLKVHRILSRALDIAHRRGHVTHNVAKLVDAPSVDQVNVRALAEEVASKILDVTDNRRNPERWSVAFSLGLRQGEALGLRWEDPADGTPLVDLDAGVMRVHWQLRRQVYQHGCGGTCGRKRGADCPRRSGGGLVYRKCKGKSSRTIAIPPELIPALRRLKVRQAAEILAFKGEWAAGGALFTTKEGRLIEPDKDYDEWVSILAEAGVRHVKLHIARHTAATILLRQGVGLSVVQGILGHRDIRTTAGYTQDVDMLMTEAVTKTVLRRRSKIEGVSKGVLHAVE